MSNYRSVLVACFYVLLSFNKSDCMENDHIHVLNTNMYSALYNVMYIVLYTVLYTAPHTVL